MLGVELLFKSEIMLRGDETVLAVREAVAVFQILRSNGCSHGHDFRRKFHCVIKGLLILVEVNEQVLRKVVKTSVPKGVADVIFVSLRHLNIGLQGDVSASPTSHRLFSKFFDNISVLFVEHEGRDVNSIADGLILSVFLLLFLVHGEPVIVLVEAC